MCVCMHVFTCTCVCMCVSVRVYVTVSSRSAFDCVSYHVLYITVCLVGGVHLYIIIRYHHAWNRFFKYFITALIESKPEDISLNTNSYSYS